MSVAIAEATAEEAEAALDGLATVLHASVLAGASVGFILPFAIEEARAFWTGLLPQLRAGDRRLLIARRGGAVVGTVQLVLARQPNGPHRAEVAKMLVHPAARRLGIARRLMLALEEVARREGRSLLVLDTASDAAEALYGSLGYGSIGRVPGYALTVHGVPEATHIMAKHLGNA
jgi:GNAT superfamily N-acetyltransferase